MYRFSQSRRNHCIRPRWAQTNRIPLEFQGFPVSCLQNILKLYYTQYHSWNSRGRNFIAIFGLSGKTFGVNSNEITLESNCLNCPKPLNCYSGACIDKFRRHITRRGAQNNIKALNSFEAASVYPFHNYINKFKLSLPRNLVASFTGAPFLWKTAKVEKILVCVLWSSHYKGIVFSGLGRHCVDTKKISFQRSPSRSDASNWHAWSCVFFALFCIVRVWVEPSSFDAMLFLEAKHDDHTRAKPIQYTSQGWGGGGGLVTSLGSGRWTIFHVLRFSHSSNRFQDISSSNRMTFRANKRPRKNFRDLQLTPKSCATNVFFTIIDFH